MLAVAALVAGTSSSHAGDRKKFSGLACVAYGSGGNSVASTLTGYIYNSSATTALAVVCPIVRDNTTVDEWLDAEVWVKDGNSSEIVECSACVAHESGGATALCNDSDTTTTFTGNTLLDFGAGPTNSFGADASYFILCSLPTNVGASSRLYNFTIDEQ